MGSGGAAAATGTPTTAAGAALWRWPLNTARAGAATARLSAGVCTPASAAGMAGAASDTASGTTAGCGSVAVGTAAVGSGFTRAAGIRAARLPRRVPRVAVGADAADALSLAAGCCRCGPGGRERAGSGCWRGATVPLVPRTRCRTRTCRACYRPHRSRRQQPPSRRSEPIPARPEQRLFPAKPVDHPCPHCLHASAHHY